MARRRIKSQALENLGQQSNLGVSDTLNALTGLADLVQVQDDVPDMSGTAQEMATLEQFDVPRVPSNPEIYDDGIPDGLEFLGNLAQAESKEDALDSFSETSPYGIPKTSTGQLQDPLETIRAQLEADPSLRELIPDETLQLLASTEPDPQRTFVSPSAQENMPSQERLPTPFESIGGAIRDYFSPTKRAEMREENERLLASARGTSGEDVENTQIPPAVAGAFERGPVENVSESDIPENGLEPVPGMVEVAENDEAITQQVKNLLRLKSGDIPDEAWQLAKVAEGTLTKDIQDLDANEQALRDRISSGGGTSLDKLAIGLALAVPVIVGLMYGKEGFIASLGGAVRGLGEGLLKQQDANTKILDKIGGIQKEKRSLKEKRQKVKEDLVSKIQNPGLKKLLNDYEVIDVVEGPNGDPEIHLGRDGIQVGNKLGISAKDESGVLWYDANLLRDDEDIKNFREASKEGREAIGKMKDANDVLDDVIDIMTLIADQNPGMMSAISQNWQGVTSKIPGFEQVTIDVVGEDGKARQVQALPLLRQKITALQDVYNKEYLGGNRLTSNLLKHWQDVFPDPSSVNAWLRSDLGTMQQQAQNFKNILNQRAMENLAAIGFLREPLQQILPVTGKDMLQSTAVDMQDIAQNPEKYRDKVRQ